MRALLTLATYVAALAATAGVAFFAVIALAGPHSDLLPPIVQRLVLILAWAVVVVLPGWLAWRVWRRGRTRSTT